MFTIPEEEIRILECLNDTIEVVRSSRLTLEDITLGLKGITYGKNSKEYKTIDTKMKHDRSYANNWLKLHGYPMKRKGH